uniref:NADH dehydrogenase subunit 6 n=1 Tax=Haloveloides papuensis TaxID=2866980 RepID=UPI001EDF7D74|nr:NADH dehydrogenase subunit 6 [Haloveloides papuensis]UIG88138.1 NADH dehydrogenase subunit 6 [Haloveloides papuensis]
MKMIMMIMLTMSTIIISMNHPLSLGLIIIIQTTLLSLMMNMMMKYPWYAYVLILTMLGGMLILFMYMASIASNEIMKFSTKILIIMIISIMIIFFLMKNENIMLNYQNMMMLDNQQNMSLMKLFNNKSSMLTIIMALYLLMTMIYVIFLINMFEGPMRKKS